MTNTTALRKLANEYIEWRAQGCPVEDPHDSYPSEQWLVFASPEAVLGLLDEVDRLRADLAQAMAERGRALTVADALEQEAERALALSAASSCACRRCIKERGDTVHGMPRLLAEMIVCPHCGDKRCVHATNHAAPCAKVDLYAHNAWVEHALAVAERAPA